jgi:hypothetical protein
MLLPSQPSGERQRVKKEEDYSEDNCSIFAGEGGMVFDMHFYRILRQDIWRSRYEYSLAGLYVERKKPHPASIA